MQTHADTCTHKQTRAHTYTHMHTQAHAWTDMHKDTTATEEVTTATLFSATHESRLIS